jgi:hypothetical protein
MRASFKRWTLIVVLAAVIVVAFLRLSGGPRATASAVAMTFVGYTNLLGNHLRFALFSVSNQAPYAVRWRSSWVEVEGSPDHKAETLNPSLPGFTREPALKARGSLRLAVGEPFYDSESGRWRFAMSFVPYTSRERWYDFSMRHKLPLRLGAVVFGDTQRMLSPSNNVTVTTAWLAK